jgi:hypothetical protein
LTGFFLADGKSYETFLRRYGTKKRKTRKKRKRREKGIRNEGTPCFAA